MPSKHFYCKYNFHLYEPWLLRQFHIWLLAIYGIQAAAVIIYTAVWPGAWLFAAPYVGIGLVIFAVYMEVKRPYLIDSVSSTLIDRNPMLELIKLLLGLPNNVYVSFFVLAVVAKVLYPLWVIGACFIYDYYLLAAILFLVSHLGFLVLRLYGIQAAKDAVIEKLEQRVEKYNV